MGPTLAKEIKTSTTMSGKTTIDNLRLEPAVNGFIISYDERTENKSKGTFDNCSYKYKKEVFDIDDANEQDDLDKAFARFRSLAESQFKELKSKKD